ncbi:light-regulated signal transduction histidine kinase (bacteriophytochrome) [Clostridium algifaecis]|uniref:Light-regulated signal transduction histidine kinase (Bacteriophytochrome) n=1 Tax=Clostridium algifaecis TaxID=1472040 RepID=A0ABS4KTI0_9CLOT|nr:hypothetical protein [Clostridium algifaecis]MBP2033360.1 light-regulated signal transduction histidine kinase (bacteriophytochrome) [Clostridium algifaecis]
MLYTDSVGVSLALSKFIIEVNGGMIDVKSNIGDEVLERKLF